MTKELNYEEAVKQLEDIVAKMENDELDIDQMSGQLKVAQRLIKQCKDKLTKADAEIKKILDSE
ncbi:exodeoxyribonuclease VII small subunit [Hoylesella oralis]|uniref:exodeoxyribonuclease VII small subunit n=1 Tax=Hoylesella oralis TaxID=28134 RepID=UPI0028EA24A3|nr:exodeoxyribonuclease VII small subunit [Hoylesella oralis]